MSAVYKSVTAANLATEHICCALSGGKNDEGLARKKAWMAQRLEEGLQFVKLDERGKIFVEFMPAELAWRPVDAPGYMLIHCLWVSGRFKGHGHAAELLRRCEEASQGTNGVVVVASKDHWLTPPKFFAHHGYEECDEAPPCYKLLVKKFRPDAPDPAFPENVRTAGNPAFQNLTLTYTAQCPFTATYVNEMAEAARAVGLTVDVKQLNTAAEVQQAGNAHGTFGIFYQGQLKSHVLMTGKRFVTWLEKEGIIK